MVNFFINNDNKIDLLQLKEGRAIKSDDKFLKKYDSNNNSVWDNDEINQFMADLENADVDGDGKIDKNESITWYSKITNTAINKVKSTFTSDDKNEVYNSLGNILRENAEEQAISRINYNAEEGLKIYQVALGGWVSKGYNEIKELFDTEYAGDRVYRQLAKKFVSGKVLELTNSKNGLTRKEYIQTKISLLKSLLGADKLSQQEQNNIENSINNLQLDELDNYIMKLTDAENEEFPKLQEKLLKDLNKNDITIRNNDAIGFENTNPKSIKAILNSSKSEEIISFDKVFELEMGVPFNQDNSIQKYENKYLETCSIVMINNKVAQIDENLSKSIAGMDGYNKLGSTTGSNNEQDALYMNLSNSILTSLKEFYGEEEEKINEVLAKYNAKLENNMITFNSQTMANYAIVDMAKDLLKNIKMNLDKIMGGKTLEDYQNELKDVYKNAYGDKNSVDLASKFQENQQEGVSNIKMGVMIGGLLVAISAPVVGILVATFGPGITSGIEAVSKEGGMTKDEAKEVAKELSLSGVLTLSGMLEGKIAMEIGHTLMKSCPKFIQYVGEYGSMAVMGALTNYAVMGDIDLTHESISNLINITMGIIAHRKMARMQEKYKAKPTEEIVNHNSTKPYSEMNEQELLAEYNKLNEQFANGKLDNQTAIDKINQIQKIIDAKGLCIRNGKLVKKDNMGVQYGNNTHLSNYVREGKMIKNEPYELNMDRLPVIKLPGGEVIDLNNLQYAKQIYNLQEGTCITIGREGNILTMQNNMATSRKHVVIYKENGQIKIRDISSNGTEIMRNPSSKAIEHIQSGQMHTNQSYQINEKNLPTLKLANQIDINLKDYKHQINSLKEGQCLTIGRDGDIRINNQYVSSQHIVIYRSNGQLKIKDISTNGTIVKVKNNIFDRIKNIFNKNTSVGTLTPKEIKILEQFKEVPEVRAVINNPAKVKKLIAKINKIIDNPKYVSPEIRAVLTEGTTTSRGQIIRNSNVSKNIMNDIVKIAETGDYISKFNSPQQALSKTPVGEVAKINGKLYVNNGYSMEPINMSEKTFRELFPPVKRFATHQGSVGTCYLVSTLENLYSSSKGRVELYRLIGEDQNGIYTKTANGNGQKTYFTRFDRYYKHIKDETGLAIIEQGYCKNTERSARAFNPRETIIMQVNAGGWSWEAIEGLLGKQPYVTHDSRNFANLIRQNANNENIVINCATKGGNGLSDRNALNGEYDIWANHEYSIKGYDSSTDCVLIANPWHSEAIIKIPMNEFLQYFDEISCIQL